MPKERTFSPVPSTASTAKASRLSVPMVLPQLRSAAGDKASLQTVPELEPERSLEASSINAVEQNSTPYFKVPPSEGDYILIDAGLIDQNAHPPRTFYLEENIKSVADSMHQSGQRDAIHVIPNPDKPGRYIIGDGWTRVLATRSYNINDNKVLAKVHFDLTEEQASWLGYSQNKDRSPPSDLDLASYYQGWHEKGVSWEEIANRAGVSKALMSYYAAFHKLDAKVLSLVRASPERFSANAVFHISRLQAQAGSDQALHIANRFLLNEQSIKQLRESVDEALERLGRQKSSRGATNKVVLHRAFPGGQFRQRQNGLVEMSATVPEDRISYFNQRLEELLKEVLLSPEAVIDSHETNNQPIDN